jgi:hypothetical protein
MYYYYNTNDKRTFNVLPYGGWFSSVLLNKSFPFVKLEEDPKGEICIEFREHLCPYDKTMKTSFCRINPNYPSKHKTKYYSIT